MFKAKSSVNKNFGGTASEYPHPTPWLRSWFLVIVFTTITCSQNRSGWLWSGVECDVETCGLCRSSIMYWEKIEVHCSV